MKKVLVVDDSPLVGKVVADHLGRLGWDVETCDRASCLLPKTMQWHPDVVLLDIMMPGLSINKLADFLEHKRNSKGLKVISFSFADRFFQEEMVKSGHVDAYFLKGRTLDGLKEVVEKVAGAA